MCVCVGLERTEIHYGGRDGGFRTAMPYEERTEADGEIRLPVRVARVFQGIRRSRCVRSSAFWKGRSRTPSSAIAANAKRMKVALMKFIVSNCLYPSAT